ncbi:MAG: fumarylacetoacetase [Bacteroidetes bacterium]|nr:MAG: fumarylacetoacetase [Bacteroidota bacterium]
MKSWIPVDPSSDFPIQNLPFGIFTPPPSGEAGRGPLPRVGVAIGDQVLDLLELKKTGVFNALKFDTNVFAKSSLNDFISLGKKTTGAVRTRISKLLEERNPELRDNEMARKKVLHKMKDVQMHLPVEIGDYTDFYSSMEHARNVGTMFRDPANALLPNWKHLPVGYHGRASSIVVSGTDFHRPKGQTPTPELRSQPAVVPQGEEKQPDSPVAFGPTKQLDFELEMAFIIGKGTKLGESVSTKDAEDYIFGMCLFNDWSARDIQAWEYVPLGPFLGKNFCSSVSPWVVTMDALEPFRVAGPKQDPEVLPYLQYSGNKNYDINLEVCIQPETLNLKLGTTVVSRSNFKYMYWNMAQQLAHHTVNGCNIRTGDMMASGTISGATPDSFGSMLELTWKGTKPIKMSDGTERKFINDNDTVIMKGFAEKDGVRVGFGEVKGKVLPAA